MHELIKILLGIFIWIGGIALVLTFISFVLSEMGLLSFVPQIELGQAIGSLAIGTVLTGVVILVLYVMDN